MASSAAPVLIRTLALRTISRAGLIAGVLDGLDAVVYFCWMRGVPVIRLFQNIAGGVLGRKTLQGGLPTAFLGVLFHFLIATGAATIYFLLSRRFSLLWRKPILCGPVFGLGLYGFMYFVVLPMSAVPGRMPPTVGVVLNELIAHIFFVGLPIAFVVSRETRSWS